LNVASVASFFVSRVDSLVDKLLDEKLAQTDGARDRAKLEALKSKAAIANAKLAYQSFERIFAGKTWDKLSAAGARPQRVLWASTSTKNPALPDTYYVDALIGPDTVNTLPPATLKAFAARGTAAATLKKGTKDAQAVMEKLADAGVDMDAVWNKLQNDGVDLFASAFKSLLASVDGKRAALAYRAGGANTAALDAHIDKAAAMRAASRIWKRDASLWSADPVDVASVNTRLGWLNSIQLMQQHAAEIKAFVEEIKSSSISDVVVLGMGGSSLAPDMFRVVFPSGNPAITGNLTVHVLDTTDPTTINNLRKRIDPCRALYIVASKSGGTVEVTSFYAYFRSLMDECAGETAGRHFVAITDEGTKLQTMAHTEGFRKAFINPSDIGGRYSALSYFGLVPAALMGVDIDQVLARAAAMAAACTSDSGLNPGLALGAMLGGAASAGRDKLCLLLSPQIAAFGAWAEQLVAESTGKKGLGIIPVDGDYGSLRTDVGADRVFVNMQLAGDATHERTLAQLRRDGHPVIDIRLNDRFDVGGEFFRWEFATAVAGAMLGVNPFDEPNVTESKVNTRRLLDEFVEHGAFASEITSRSAYGQINKFLRSAGVGDYISLQCYLPYSDKLHEMLEKLREKIGQNYGVPVTLGFGPRFLHSTGQLHKGGANNVVALQLTYDPDEDLPIPGEPYTFGTLIRAQALGDIESLRAHERRAMRIHLVPDILAGLRKVNNAIKVSAKPRPTGTRTRKPKAPVEA
jgi:transaldolase/glucose-6-phosphate isomerase